MPTETTRIIFIVTTCCLNVSVVSASMHWVKTSGKAKIFVKEILEQLGLELDDESMKKVTDRIIELGDRKELVTQEDLPYIISDVLSTM